MTPEQQRAIAMAKARQRKAQAQSAAPMEQKPSRFEAGVQGAMRGATLGTLDEVQGTRAQREEQIGMAGKAMNLVNAAVPFNPMNIGDAVMGTVQDVYSSTLSEPKETAFSQARDARREYESELREAHPASFLVGEVIGSAAAPGGAVRGVTKAGQIAKAAGAAGTTGAGYGFLAGEGDVGDRLETAALGAVTGGLLGGVLGTALPRNIATGKVDVGADGQPASRRALKTIERILRNNGFSPDEITTGMERIKSGLDSVESPSALPVRFKDLLVAEFGDETGALKRTLETQVRGGALQSGSVADATVQQAIKRDNQAARDLVDQTLSSNLGDLELYDMRGAAVEQMQTLVDEQYRPLLAAAPAEGEQADQLRRVLTAPRMQKLTTELAEDAEREGLSLESLIQTRPAEAAHWMQSKARELADSQASLGADGKYRPERLNSNRRRDILNALEDLVPGYAETRKAYGDAYGVTRAVNFARSFSNKAADANSVREMADELAEMSAAEQAMAKAAVRDFLAGKARQVSTKGEDAVNAPRMTVLGNENVLSALTDVFGDEGQAIADDVTAIATRLSENARLNPAAGSNTIPNDRAIKQARSNTQGPIGRLLSTAADSVPTDFAVSMLAGAPAPAATARAGLKGFAGANRGRAASVMDEVTQMLMAERPAANSAPSALPPVGSAPPTLTGSSGNVPPAAESPRGKLREPPRPGGLLAGREPASPSPEAAPGSSKSNPYIGRKAFRTQGSGLPGGTEAQGAAAGAFVGGLAPADNTEERLQRMAIGAGLGAGAGAASRLPMGRAGNAFDDVRSSGPPKQMRSPSEKPLPERYIRAPAVRWKGKLYTGDLGSPEGHYGLYKQISLQGDDLTKAEEGFMKGLRIGYVDNTGQFYNRDDDDLVLTLLSADQLSGNTKQMAERYLRGDLNDRSSKFPIISDMVSALEESAPSRTPMGQASDAFGGLGGDKLHLAAPAVRYKGQVLRGKEGDAHPTLVDRLVEMGELTDEQVLQDATYAGRGGLQQGFVDSQGKFYERADPEGLLIAHSAGQLLESVRGTAEKAIKGETPFSLASDHISTYRARTPAQPTAPQPPATAAESAELERLTSVLREGPAGPALAPAPRPVPTIRPPAQSAAQDAFGPPSRFSYDYEPVLPMDEASRMERAREMGFDVDTPLYHGTDADFKAFRRSRAGNARGAGTYFTDDAAIASKYATGEGTMRGPVDMGGAGPNVVPTYIRGDIFEETAAATPEIITKLEDGARKVGIDIKPGELAQAFDMPATARDILQYLTYQPDEANRILQAAGFGGRRGDGIIGGADVVVFDPKNIRSRFARFDPAQAGSTDLMAGLPLMAGAGLASMGMTLPEDDTFLQKYR